jgi:membrane protease YdiL (CAAX protease family)
MKSVINWKLFLILVIASVAATLLVLPFAVALSPALAQALSPVILLAQILQSLVLFSIATFVGLYLAKRVGFGLPVLEAGLEGKQSESVRLLRSFLWLAIGMGVLASVLIVLFSTMFWQVSRDLLNVEMAIPTWKAFLASLYGGIAEEILFRLFLMTLFVWISTKIKTTHDGRPTAIGVWLSIVVSSVLFGLGHLPITGDLIQITPNVVVRAVLLNGVAAVIFGWLYQKHGLESAMIAHFSCDIGLHVVVPLGASLFV